MNGCACKNLGEILAQHKLMLVRRWELGRGVQEKRSDVLNGGVNLTGRPSGLGARGSWLLLETRSQPPEKDTHQVPSGAGTSQGRDSS